MIPSFNCAPQISRLITALIPHTMSWDEIWFVDNRSQDATVNTISNSLQSQEYLEQKVKLFRNSENCGLGGTHKLAFKAASNQNFSSITVLHGDDQSDIRDAVKALRKLKEEPDTFVLGARFHKDSQLQGYSSVRKIYNVIMNILFSFRFRVRIYDLGSGLNVFPIGQLADLDMDGLPNDLTFNVEFLKWIIRNKKKVHWLPITWREVDQISNVAVFSQTLQTIALLLTRFGRRGVSLDSNINQSRISIFNA